MMEFVTTVYNVAIESSIKDKVSESGYLIACEKTSWIWLKNEASITIRKGQIPKALFCTIKSGLRFPCGSYMVTVLKEKGRTTNTASDSFIKKDDPSTAEVKSSSESNVKIEMQSTSSKVLPSLDSVLIRSMKPHQIEAANFILKRFNDLILPNHLPETGAILADDVGTGKTLVAISVVWAMCRHGLGKGVIVCPSSLLNNWKNEVAKWLPNSLSRTALYVSGGKNAGTQTSDAIVYDFVSSHCSVRPLLVLSYDMFRVYGEALNTISTFYTIVCDEGHRLKNSVGTKTSLALGNCCAMNRLVITGTPIQNNLEELFAVVNFAIPGYLGTISEFQSEYVNPIFFGRSKNSTLSQRREGELQSQRLGDKLSKIVIRRNRDVILRGILPPRSEYIVSYPMSQQQLASYVDVIVKLITASDDTCKRPRRDGVADPKANITVLLQHVLSELERGNMVPFNKLSPSAMCHSSIDAEGLEVCSDQGSADSDHNSDTEISSKRSRKGHSKKRGKREEEEEEEEEEEDTSAVPTSWVLPGLLLLRQICSAYLPVQNSEDENVVTGADKYISQLLNASSKMEILRAMLRSMASLNEKIVIVSNFIFTLNVVEKLLENMNCKFLRIDGTVPTSKRQVIVDDFNRIQSRYKVMLLSVKAGGVGLNLTAASRLILLEPDWNPATDVQAMGRIWRVGQTRPVVVYRLICSNSIEETILRRQRIKGGLASIIREYKPPSISLPETNTAVQEISAKDSVVEDERDTRVLCIDDSDTLIDAAFGRFAIRDFEGCIAINGEGVSTESKSHKFINDICGDINIGNFAEEAVTCHVNFHDSATDSALNCAKQLLKFPSFIRIEES